MPVFQVLLLLLLGLNVSAMLSGFMLARRMGYYLMKQVMVLMILMLVSVVTAAWAVLFPVTPVFLDLLHILLLVNLVLSVLALVMEFIQIFPILLKTMQGGPIHSSHMTNLLLSVFLALGLAIYYVELAII
ncbi:hypothetical protein EU538_09675 [Candidatus Thorarchaeota archaeon]|nr:MAG: hypothetical protein EU538_09675 [Candidatus Thorarchaeota archaeon]